MGFFDDWQMVFKDRGGIVDTHRDDRAAGFFGDFETAVMKRHKGIVYFVPGPFGENADRDAGFDFFDTGQDRLKPFFDIFPV